MNRPWTIAIASSLTFSLFLISSAPVASAALPDCPPPGADTPETWEAATPLPRPFACHGTLGFGAPDLADWFRTTDVSTNPLTLEFQICARTINHEPTLMQWSVGFREASDAQPSTKKSGNLGFGECVTDTAARGVLDSLPGEWYIKVNVNGCTCVGINYDITIE